MMGQLDKPLYDATFFEEQISDVLQSARVVVPFVMELLQPKNVVDIGCGTGGWLSVFSDHGVSNIIGIDGPYINLEQLLIPKDRFVSMDLSQKLDLRHNADLVICLEVAEHLPTRQSRELVRFLTETAPVVLFSAAVPGQGGRHHVNEQWPSYWRLLFQERGFRKLDPIRRNILHDRRVLWWYRQNLLIYASESAIQRVPALRSEAEHFGSGEFEIVNEAIFSRFTSVTGLRKELVRSIIAAIKRRIVALGNRI